MDESATINYMHSQRTNSAIAGSRLAFFGASSARWLRHGWHDDWSINCSRNRSDQVRIFIYLNNMIPYVNVRWKTSGVEVLVSGNVPTLFGGASNEMSVMKGGEIYPDFSALTIIFIQGNRLHQIAVENRLPTVSLTQSVRYWNFFPSSSFFFFNLLYALHKGWGQSGTTVSRFSRWRSKL